jgi:hypothetical protein
LRADCHQWLAQIFKHDDEFVNRGESRRERISWSEDGYAAKLAG